MLTLGICRPSGAQELARTQPSAVALGYTLSRLRRCWSTHYSPLVPANGALAQVDMDLLRFEELFDTMKAQFPAVTALLVPSPGSLDIAWLHRIDPHNSSAKTLYHSHAPENISRPYRGCQTVRRIVGYAQRVLFILERNASDHRTKDFFSSDTRTVVGFKNRRFDK